MKKIIPVFVPLLFFCIVQVHAQQFTVVGTDLPPLMYHKDGKAVGFYVDILQGMLEVTEGVDVDIKFYPATRMFRVLSESNETFSLGVARNKKREHLYKWVGPIYPRIFGLYKLKERTDLKIDSLEDVKRYKVGVGRGYAALDDLLNAGIPPEKIQQVTDDGQTVGMLLGKRVDLVIMNDVMLSYRLKERNYRWSDVEKVLILNDKYQFWYAFNKGIEDEVIEKLQRALDRLKQTGVHGRIVKKYFE